MPPHSRLQLTRIGGAALLPLLILSGCATQEAVKEQTDPLQSQLDRLERSLETTTAAARTAQQQALAAHAQIDMAHNRETALAAQVQSLAKETEALQQKLAEQAERQASGEARLAERDTYARGAMSRASAMAGELKPMQDKIATIEASLPRQGERITQAELKIDELGTNAGGAAAQVADIRDKLTVLQAGQKDDASEFQALDERLGRLEARLGSLAADLNERLSRVDQSLNEVSALAREARAIAAQGDRRIVGNVLFTVTLTEDKTMFPLSAPELGSQDIARLEGLLTRLRTLGNNYHLEIQGHTENSGYDDYNYELGRARAEVVKRYLNEKGSIPLTRMSVVSFGSISPIVNKSIGNRRIMIVVLE